MKLTTQTPPVNVLEVLPELHGRAATTVRLHPRRGEVNNLAASKFGGSFLWPENRTWPGCPEQGQPDWEPAQAAPPEWWGNEPWLRAEDKHSLLVPVLQL